jgi:hypothetical protein
MRISAVLLTAILCSSLAACDGGDAKPKADPAAEAKAKEEADKKARIEERRKKREAEAKAKEEEAKKHQEAIDAVLLLPEKMPKKLDKACKAVGDAQDAFMNRLYEGETVTKWNNAKGTQLPMTIAQCTKHASLEVAACQANALTIAPPELKKALPDLLRGCIEKFGKKPEGDTPPA